MLDLIVNTIAVPFGYTSDLNEDNFPRVGDPFIITADMWTNDLRSPGGWSLLPDIIQSNTPPPSPLRRALSSSFVFPDKSAKISQTDVQPNTEAESLDTRSVQSSLSETQEEEKIIKKNTDLENASEELEGDQLGQDSSACLPELSWRLLPFCQRSSPDLCHEAIRQENERQGSASSGEGTSSYTRMRDTGSDLRKIADQFELDNAKMNRKREEEMALKLALPEAFSQCVSVSIFFLIWWRLFNKFR